MDSAAANGAAAAVESVAAETAEDAAAVEAEADGDEDGEFS